MILGLGVAQILTSAIAVFRSRHHGRLDWIPCAWAGCIFLWHLQFWWGILELPRLVTVWTLTDFLLFVTLTLLLFISASLILPSKGLDKGERLLQTFERDGRWALVSLGCYLSLGLVADFLFWKSSPYSPTALRSLILVVLPLLVAFWRRPKAQAVITALNVALSLWAFVSDSPARY